MPADSQFSRFASVVRNLPAGFELDTHLPAALRMTGDGRFDVFYAPFDWVNMHAKVVLVGITPGRVQAIEALRSAQAELVRGADESAAAERAKSAASFAGPMRNNLVRLLDHVGLADRLGIPSTVDLWSMRTNLVHFTSALRYPVFEAGRNYSGSGITRHRLLREQMQAYFGSECQQLSRALFVPLGASAEAACSHMVESGLLSDNRVLRGLPHPSGANAERIAYFLGRKERRNLSSKTRPEPIEAGRETALRAVAAWAS